MAETVSDRLDRQHLAILKEAVDNTNEAFVTIDLNHRVMFFNRAAERFFGYGREEILGRDLNLILSPMCSRDHKAAVDRYIQTREKKMLGKETEFMVTRKNGETFPASISFSVSEIDQELYFTGIVRDLTVTKTLQEQVSKAERLAALGQVVAEITHEIKNPLMLIGGFARQVARSVKEQENADKLDIISREISRLENLLAELRELYRFGKPSFSDLDVSSVVQEVLDLVSDEARDRHIEISSKGVAYPVLIRGDRDKLKQVLINLVKNSMEAMEEEGKIRVELDMNRSMAHLLVADNGPGIPEKDRQAVFDPFFTTKPRGTGLGLAVSKRIVEDHNGTFSLESEEGKGTSIRIDIPISQTEERVDGDNIPSDGRRAAF